MATRDNTALDHLRSPGGRLHVIFKLNRDKSFHQNYIQLDRVNRRRVKQMVLAMHRPHLWSINPEMLTEFMCAEAFQFRHERGWFVWHSTVCKQYPRSKFEDHDVPAEDPAWRKLEAEFNLVDDVNSY